MEDIVDKMKNIVDKLEAAGSDDREEDDREENDREKDSNDDSEYGPNDNYIEMGDDGVNIRLG